MANIYSFAESGPISAREGGKASIRVSRSGDLGDGAAVIIATNGSAVAGASPPSISDYDLGSGNPGGSGFWLNFFGNETEKVLDIPIPNDSVSESTEDFYISITSGSGPSDGVSGPSPVQVNIADGGRNDGKPPFVLPNGKPPFIDPNNKPNNGGQGGKPPVIGPNGKPPVGGPNNKPDIIGPGGKPPVLGPDGKPPTDVDNAGPKQIISLTGASFSGKSLELEFDDLIAPGTLNKNLFSVRVDGKKAVVSSAIVEADDFIATLVLAKEIPSTSKVTVSYKDLKGDQLSGVLQDLDGIDLPSIINAPADPFF